MTEPDYIPIYCQERAVLEARHLIANPHYLGRCFATKQDGVWRCCCCGKSVKVCW